MTETNKELAETVWRATDNSQSASIIAAIKGMPSVNTVARLIRARKAFQGKRLDGEIARTTGWSVELVAKVRQWWTGYEASQNDSQKPPKGHEERPAGSEDEVPEGGSDLGSTIIPTKIEAGSIGPSLHTPAHNLEALRFTVTGTMQEPAGTSFQDPHLAELLYFGQLLCDRLSPLTTELLTDSGCMTRLKYCGIAGPSTLSLERRGQE